jgi:hypothetical protein
VQSTTLPLLKLRLADDEDNEDDKEAEPPTELRFILLQQHRRCFRPLLPSSSPCR